MKERNAILRPASARPQVRTKNVSQRNRNVRSFTALRMSAGLTFTSALGCRLAPGMILGWTPGWLWFILLGAVGRIGLRRSATRALDGRLYASRPGLRLRSSACFRIPGVGRQSAKLRGFGGSAPTTRTGNDLVVLQVMLLKAEGHRAIQSQFDDHGTAPLAGIDRR